MKALLATLASAALALAIVNAQSTTTTVTQGGVTTTTSSGTLHQYTPGTAFILNETSGPVTYSYGPEVVYATSAGTVLTPEQVQARIRVGIPVRVEYVPQGETRVIRRVLVDADDDDDDE